MQSIRMTVTPYEEFILVLIPPSLFMAFCLLYSVYRAIHTYAKANCTRHIAEMMVTTHEPHDEDIRTMLLRYPSSIILEAVLFISEHIYGNAIHRLSLIIEVCEVDYHLLRRIRGSCNRYQRILLISNLTQFIPSVTVVEEVEQYIDTSNRQLSALITTAFVAAHPDLAIRYITRYPFALTAHDIAALMQLMHRTGSTIAYTPLLSAQNRNLQLLGIYICRHFAVVDAEPHLQRLCISEDGDIAIAALYALCYLRGNIANPQVRRAAKRLQQHQRSALIRHMVRSCYSLRSCAHLLDSHEQRRFSQLLNTYKAVLICN